MERVFLLIPPRLISNFAVLEEVSLPSLDGEMLAEVVLRNKATACCLDRWNWREMKAVPVSEFDGVNVD